MHFNISLSRSTSKTVARDFYLLVCQEPYLGHPSWWAVVDDLDGPKGHAVKLWRKTGGTQNPTDNAESAGGWYFNNATEKSGHSRYDAEGDITVKCIE